MGKEFSITPRTVPRIETKYRRIVTPIPHPDSVPTLEKLRHFEPQSMRGQPPIVWEQAQDIFVNDKYGNRWLDWSSGVLVTNSGHCAPEVKRAILDQVNSNLLHNYCFPSEERAALVEELAALAPEGLKKVFLLTTGSEATECAIKLSRAHGIKVGGKKKIGIIGWERGYHGRTLGSQQAGGMAGQKNWIVNEDPAIITAPFPDGYWQTDTSFELFLKTVAARGLQPENVAGVIMETYQGVGPDFAPVEFVRQLRAWCDANQIVLTFDEVQAGFGRTGKFWAFEHYGVSPDLICCGKGISSSLPLSAVIGREAIMDQFPPGSMTSTHTGNPVSAAAALASLRIIVRDKLADNAAALEPLLLAGLKAIQAKHPSVIGHVTARGLVAGMQTVKPGKKEPDHDLAHAIIERCMWKGLLLFAPVGAWGQTVKIAPPLTIPRDALEESLAVLAEATDEAIAARV
ncbi:MAG: aminotransferase class III-fold pyridoxal phosphate-dependent enzyme [Verrucomicrobia bacterium]|nr:aminotransferase class III-fold pyridoxal phosphate-dependent enzyme [Verrucomicrobiota bacterium]MBM3871550.1 aminotransferase class III-fold pyridoxal phosphate-dependent enzyme [Verrucomicrobiota bacterium]